MAATGARRAFLGMCVVAACLVAAAADVPQWFLAAFLFLALKMATGYEKCTLSYAECRLRGVRKERGWIYRPLHDVVTLRDEQPAAAAGVALVAGLLCAHYFLVLRKRLVL